MKLFAGFGWRHLCLALAFGIGVPLTAAILKTSMGGAPLRHLSAYGGEALLSFVIALCAMLAAVAVDNRLPRLPTLGRLGIAVVAAAVSATLLAEAFQALVEPFALMPKMEYAGLAHRIAFHFAGIANWSLVLVTLYTLIEGSRRATAALHAARRAALAAEHELVEGDLRAMQARVEPELLFSALLAIDEAYQRGVHEGEQALDALIAYLRAALPAETSGTSTVAAELELVRSYLRVVELVSAAKLRVEVAVDAPAQTRPLPAMLLLPLVRWTLDGAASLSMDARVHERRLELTLKSDSRAAAPGDISGLQARLAQLFAGAARLETAPGPNGRDARLEIPLAA